MCSPAAYIGTITGSICVYEIVCNYIEHIHFKIFSTLVLENIICLNYSQQAGFLGIGLLYLLTTFFLHLVRLARTILWSAHHCSRCYNIFTNREVA